RGFTSRADDNTPAGRGQGAAIGSKLTPLRTAPFLRPRSPPAGPTMKMPPLSFELKLLEHTPLSESKYAVLYRIGSVAMLSAQVTRARRGKGWCVCNVIITSPQLAAGWSPQMQMGWEHGIAAALRIDPRRYSLVFHW